MNIIQHYRSYLDPISEFSQALHIVLGLYLQESGDRLLGNVFNVHNIPRKKILNIFRVLSNRIEANSWQKHFSFDLSHVSIERHIGDLYAGFERVIQYETSNRIQKHVPLPKRNLSPKQSIYGIGSDKVMLEEVIDYLDINTSFFKNLTFLTKNNIKGPSLMHRIVDLEYYHQF